MAAPPHFKLPPYRMGYRPCRIVDISKRYRFSVFTGPAIRGLRNEKSVFELSPNGAGEGADSRDSGLGR